MKLFEVRNRLLLAQGWGILIFLTKYVVPVGRGGGGI